MRKIWNRPAWPVWSLSIRDKEGTCNMNICTYVQVISMQPKKVMVAVFKGTKTLHTIQASPREKILLQLLPESLAPTVRVLGRQSGFTVDKVKKLKKKYSIAYKEGLPYFTGSCGFILLDNLQMIDVSGDHYLCVGEVVASKNLSEETILTTDFLRDKNYIR